MLIIIGEALTIKYIILLYLILPCIVSCGWLLGKRNISVNWLHNRDVSPYNKDWVIFSVINTELCWTTNYFAV